jgi:predicted MFS family arabinose efflux permease
MVLSGLLLPPVLAHGWGWPIGWLVLAAMTVVATALAIPAVGRVPRTADPATIGTGTSLAHLRPILLAYLLYGAGYYALMTFVIVYLHAAGYGHARIVDFWIVAGLAVSASMFVWGPLLARVRGSHGVALTTGVLIASALVLMLLHGLLAVMLSAVLFGGSLMSAAFAHLDYARELVPPHAWTRIIATMTVMFSLGQTTGPLLCGSIADHGGLRVGMFAAIGLLVLCIALASLQRGSRDVRP